MKTGIPTKGTYLEPDYEDLKRKLVGEILRKNQPLAVSDSELSSFLSKWSWSQATSQLLDILLK